MKKTVLSLSFLLGVAPAFAGLQEGLDASEKNDWPTAIAELTPVAKAGNPEAASVLGDHYRYADDEQAVKWSLVAAQHGDVKMQYEMGVRIDDIAWRLFRFNEQPAKRYFRTAADCFQMAADQGYAPAQNALGMMYEVGMKLPADVKKGVTLYRAAARQGYAQGLQNMAVMYQQGRGVRRSLSTAYTLYQAALKYANGDRDVKDLSGLTSRELERDLSAGEIQRAKAVADAWSPGMPLVGLE
ncbi:tetratricopeptide repeat protein [Burkholderia sp. F1]|uniref:tetratricopeptide repeat protein n=1 Tax=Burkholderia sp. F1 TaxID=3366817 RepID=UPI003D756DB2